MSLFGSILGGGLGLLGGILGGEQEEEGALRALQASRPLSVTGPGGSATFKDDRLTLGLSPELQARQAAIGQAAGGVLGDLSSLPFAEREASELERLRTLRRPEIDSARAQLQSRLINRGRAGLGVGGGLSGKLFNPESAALEEAILRTDLGDIGAARDFSRGDQRFLLQQLQGLQGLQSGILAGPQRLGALGIGAATPPAVAGMQAIPGFNRADTTRGFFSTLGNTLAGADFSKGLSGLFF